MAVNSTSSSSANWASMFGIKNNGIGGLATGLDTDSLVEALTSGTRSKIAKQSQDKQLLNWKMTAYRSMSTALKAFQTKSFSYQSNSNTNIMSSGFFNTYKSTSSSSKVSVAPGSSTSLGSFTIDAVQQLATAETVTSTKKLSTDLLLGGLTDGQNVGADAFTGQTLKLDYNGTVKTVKLDDLNSAIDGDGKLNLEDFKDGLQALLDKNFSTKNVYNKETDEYDKVSNVGVSIVTVNVTDKDGKVVLDENGDPKTVDRIKLDSDSAKLTIATDNYLLGVSEGDSSRVSVKTKIGAISAFSDIQGDVLTFNINGTEISVNKNESLETMMNRINASEAGVRMTYSSNTDMFTLTSKATGGGENIIVSDVQGNLMNQIFGVRGGNSIGTDRLITAEQAKSQEASKIYGLEKGDPDLKSIGARLKNMMFDLTINGVTKTVKVDTTVIGGTEDNIDPFGKGNFDINDVYKAINKGITNAFGADAGVTFYDAGNGITGINTSNAVSLDGGGIMDILGFTEKTSNSITNLGYGSEIKATVSDPYTLAEATTGTMSMTINGVTRQLELDSFGSEFGSAALNAAISKAFGADVAKSVNFTAKYEFEDATQAEDEDGNLLYHDEEETQPIMVPGALKNVTFTLNINDPDMAVSIGNGENDAGTGKVNLFEKIGFDGYELDGSGNPDLTKPIAYSNSTFGGITLGELAGGKDLTAGTLTINDKTVSYNKNTSLQEFASLIKSETGGSVDATIVDGQLKITSNTGSIDISDTGTLLKDMFGIAGGSYKTAAEETDAEGNSLVKRTEGKNAEIVVDGTVISRASNTIEVNGVNITVNQVTEKGEAPIKIDVTSDPTEVVDRIQGWMDDYNAMIFTLNSAINESKNGDYFPLTDEQRSGMTEDQIKTWETEAKKGLLRNDNTLRQILADLRASLYEKVESVGLSIYDLGITTKKHTTPNEAGQIEFTDASSSANGLSGKDRLSKLLESDPDKVRLFFTDANQGLAVRMNSIIDKAANPSSVNRGSLVRLAGTEISTGDNTSTLGNKISAIDKYIASLKNRMESEYNRYWKKFSALEVAVQRMSAQSSWLNQ